MLRGILYLVFASSMLVAACASDAPAEDGTPSSAGAGGANAGVGGASNAGIGVSGGGAVAGDATLSDPMSASGGASGDDAQGGSSGGTVIGEPEQPAGVECLGGRVDVQQHSAHCGMCGHACEPVVLATGLNWPVGIALNATTAFFITGGNEAQVMSVPIEGGEVTVLAEAQPFPMDIKVDATSVYWAGYGNVHKVALGGGTPQRLMTAIVEPYAIALDTSHVYFANHGESSVGSVMKVPLEGGEPIALVSMTGSLPGSIAIDASFAYFITRFDAAGSAVMKVPLEGGEPTTLIEAAIAGWAIAVDATDVYWLESALDAPGTASALKKVPLAGGTSQTMATSTHLPSLMAIDDISVYWTHQSTSIVVSAIPGTDGSVNSVPRAGGTALQLGPDQDEPAAIATNGRNLCWTTTGTGPGGGSIKCLATCNAGTCGASSQD